MPKKSVKPKRVLVFDTTLRDGNQTPNASFSRSDKVAIAKRLADIGVDVVEAGFPAAGEGDFKAVHEIAGAIGDRVIVSAFSRILPADIEAACLALEPAKAYGNARVHTGIGTSPSHITKKLRKTPEQILEATRLGVAKAKEFTDDVQFYAEDATRSDFTFLMRVLLEAAHAGATTLMIADTVGIATPVGYAQLIANIKRRLDKELGTGVVAVSAHCHNDLGLATSNSLAAVAAGVDQVEVAVGGLGERAGNASLEQLVANLRLRPEAFGNRTTDVDTTMLTSLTDEVTHRAGFTVPPSSPVVGDNAFKHASGIHQNGVEKDSEVYEPYDPTLVGQKTSMSNDALSGRSGIKSRLKHLGIEPDADAVKEISGRAKRLADEEGRNVVDSDVEWLAATVDGEELVDSIDLEDWTASKSKGKPSAGKVLIGGVRQTAETYGGELDAVASAINQVTGLNGEVKSWFTVATGLSDSTAAQIGVFATVMHDSHEVEVYGHSSSSLEAAVNAYVKALNMLRRIEARTKRT